MPNEGDPYEVQEKTPPRTPPCLAELPNELLFCIMRFSIAVGREADASALARTNSTMRSKLNKELYKLVIKYKTFHILHWATRRNQKTTLKIALANGANPNEMWTAGGVHEPRANHFRPAGWGLNTAQKLDRAVLAQLGVIFCPYAQPQGSRNWVLGCFSSPSLSLPNAAHLQRLWHHYHNASTPAKEKDYETDDGNDDTRLEYLSGPLQDDVTFPENMSPTDMDQRIVKIGFLRLFRQWHHPLHVAALHDRTLITGPLLAHGADVDSTSVQVCSCPRNSMPSILAVSPTINCLVAYTPLHVAICSGNYKTAKLLVAHGAYRMAKVFSGSDNRAWLSDNALHEALSHRPRRNGFDYDFIEFLLSHGFAARIEERNHENLTPLLIACNVVDDSEREDVVKLLLYYGAQTENQGPCPSGSAFSGPLSNNPVELATPALWAARKGQFRLAKLLLDRGAHSMTKSSSMRVTMLHAVCSNASYSSVPQDRIDLLDYLLARSTEKELNAFDATGCTPLTMLIRWKLHTEAQSYVSVMESKLFRKGANIMAGIELGKETPFEVLIQESLQWCTMYVGVIPIGARNDVGNKVLAALRVFRINQHPRRPTAFLNQFWGYLDRALRAVHHSYQITSKAIIYEMVSCVLHALIKAGFSPAEVDRHGDTAMTSFLKLLLDKPLFAVCDRYPFGDQGWLIQSIMALLQENGAALQVRNKEGYTAFDYLKKILEYDDGEVGPHVLPRVIGKQVQPGQDEHGNMCFKFHPNEHLFGSLGGGSTLQMIHQNPSNWLVCEHWCRSYCGVFDGANGQCGCARTRFQTLAKCEGDCVDHDSGQ